MRFADPAGLWWALLAAPVVLLHFLKPRRPPHVVSSTFLWRAVERPITSASPFRMIRPSWLLLLQLLAVGLLAAAIADPERVEETTLAEHTVFLIDGSGSMLALDGDPDRISDARTRAVEVRSELPSGGTASVIEVGPEPRVLLSASADPDAFEEAVAATRATPGRADFAAAFALAEGLETTEAPIGFVLLSDGGLSEEEQRLLPPGTTYEQVGSAATNRAVADLDIEARSTELHVRVVVDNRGGPSAVQTLRLDVDGRTRERVELSLPAGETVVHETDLTAGDRVDAFLEGEDLLAADNRRVAVSRRRQPIRVRVESAGPDPFLDALLSSIDGLTLLEDGDPDPPDLIVYNRSPVPFSPKTPFLAIRPPGGAPGVSVSGETETPALTLVRSGDSLLQGIDLSDLAVATAQRVRSETTQVLLGAESAPLLLRGRTGRSVNRRPAGDGPGGDAGGADGIGTGRGDAASEMSDRPPAQPPPGGADESGAAAGTGAFAGTGGGVRFAYLAFGLGDSNLPLLLAFPLLGDRLLTELTGALLPPSSIEVGETLAVSSQSGVTVIDPAGTVVELTPGASGLVVERPGLWRVAAEGRPELSVAVNPAAAESTITPVPALPTESRPPRPGEPSPGISTSLRPWLLALALVVVAAEFLLARRRIGVSPRQWKLAAATRFLVAAALLGAFLDLGFDRDAGDVATVFVVDASDSLGIRGRRQAIEFVREALEEQPRSSRAGVVLFGGDARIELLLRRQAFLGQPSVQIDPSRSNLAAALRLGGAILPADARRRVVLLSDGRSTEGDPIRESARLGGKGVSVDTVLLDDTESEDIAIGSVRTPNRVSEGEVVPVDVEIVSTFEGRALVTLRADGEIVSEREIEVRPGAQRVTLTDETAADGGGLRRYQVDVESLDDNIMQNNTAFAAVSVEGPAKVLMVEGTDGGGEELAAALEAGGLEVDTVPTSGIPQLGDLLSYASILLVDVDQRHLSAHQVDILNGAVRDGGRGLLSIGGSQSYGLGGYYKSELERLLPVVSEILDVKRRQSVAEVLAIDTSGSMGACHCAEGQFESNRLDGGVNKNDISRAAAARTIAALGENDEIGVLAFDVEDRWVIDLQKLPAQDVVNEGLSRLNPGGGTNPAGTLDAAAAALRDSNAALKHVIMFTDGFTSPELLAAMEHDARRLAEEGITVSVVATGEGAAVELAAVAAAGRGRFYRGRDLQKIPQIIMDEAVLASRDFVNEGEFLPVVTSRMPVVSGLEESPPLLGYVATTAKPRAFTLLKIGPDGDPLLARWQVGLGTATSWTSDASTRWSKLWADWDGYVQFWSRVVRDTFPSLGDGTTAVIEDGMLRVHVETDAGDDGGYGSDATAVASITDPSFAGREIALSRVSPDTFAGELPVDEKGVYLVGTSVTAADGSTAQGAALVSQSYGREYEPGAPNGMLLARAADAGSGRTGIAPSMAFDTVGLVEGRSRVMLADWLMTAAALLFAAAVVFGRLTMAPVNQAVSSRWGPLAQRLGRADGRAAARRLARMREARGARKAGGRSQRRPGAQQPAGGQQQPERSAEGSTARADGIPGDADLDPRDRLHAAAEEDALILEELAQADELAEAAETAETGTVSALLKKTQEIREKRERDFG